VDVINVLRDQGVQFSAGPSEGNLHPYTLSTFEAFVNIQCTNRKIIIKLPEVEKTVECGIFQPSAYKIFWNKKSQRLDIAHYADDTD
jgi:hypothetical protein